MNMEKISKITGMILLISTSIALSEENNHSPGEVILKGLGSYQSTSQDGVLTGAVTLKKDDRELPVQYIKVTLGCQNGVKADTSTDKDGMFYLPIDKIRACKDGNITVVSNIIKGSRQLTNIDKKNLEIFKIEGKKIQKNSNQ
jgi:hypothetical protein